MLQYSREWQIAQYVVHQENKVGLGAQRIVASKKSRHFLPLISCSAFLSAAI